MKVAIIGVGGMGTVHSNCLKAMYEEKGLELVGIADCRPDFLARAAAVWPSAKQYESGEALLADTDAALVHICVSSDLHAELALAAMARGIAVMLEKPVCLTETDCQRLLAAQAATGAKVMVGQVLRSFSQYRFLKETFESGTYGALKSINMQRLSGYVDWGFENWFQDESRCGSVVMDLHIHDLDFLRWMLGEPDKMQVVLATAFDNGMVNHVVTQYQFGKVQALAEGLWDVSGAHPFGAVFEAHFEEATIVYDGRQEVSLKVYTKDKQVIVPQLTVAAVADEKSEGLNIAARGPYYDEIAYFIDCLQTGTENTRAPLAEGVASVRLALAEAEQAKRLCQS